MRLPACGSDRLRYARNDIEKEKMKQNTVITTVVIITTRTGWVRRCC